ncbi:transmembrane protein 132C-like [Haliotis cracherodii]|uniref:transmembrane protein 132C-like n=1 Tax=Haliotis cracherodii TaxID=6455 RepID=UPI0039EC7BC7
MAKTADLWTYFCVVTVFGLVRGVDISFNDPNDGFFLKSSYQKLRTKDPRVTEKEAFIVTHPSELYKLRVHHGPFEVYQSVPDALLEEARSEGENLNLMHRQILYNTDMSAHIVTDRLTPKWSLLQVLVHAQPFGSRKADGMYNVYGYDQQWCGQMFVEHQHQQLSAVCVLSERDSVCVMGIELPSDWWHHNDTDVSVYYHVSRVGANHECASASNSIVPGRSMSGNTDQKKTFIATIRLAEKEYNYEIRKDQNLIFHVPTQDFFPAAKFDVPVYLDTGSKLQVIVIKVKVRNGLLIRDAVVSENSPWSIYVEISDRQRSATVTAFVKDTEKLSQRSSSLEIFHWQFEVEDSIMSPENGRIIWTIDYEKNAPALNSYYPPRNSRVTARIKIAGRYHERIVPVFKETEILNTAILTGERLSFPLKVYAVSDVGIFRDVSVLTACHSTDKDVLKVAPDCSEIYFEGNETRGSHNVTVIAKTGLYTDNMYIRVWVPESRLDIQLSDNKLGQIRGWKVQTKAQRSKRSVDFGLLTHSGFYVSDRNQKLDRHGCQLRLQQAEVEVFTRFHIESRSRIDYYHNRKAYLKVTDIVLKRMRMSDPRIASLEGNIIQGLGQGRTEVQVLSPTGRVMAAREVRVGKEKVVIERLLIRVISGVRLDIVKGSLPGTLTAIAHLEHKLMSKHKEASLDVSVQYSDGTSFPLKYINSKDYDIKISSLNHHVIDILDTDNYEIRAVGEGSDEFVKVVFRHGDQCPRKRSRPLSTTYVYVTADFSKEGSYHDSLQSDGNYNNRASGRWEDEDDHNQNIQKIHIDNKDKYFQHQSKSKFDKILKKDKSDPQVIPVDLAFGNLPMSKPKSEAHQQPIRENNRLSPLEIGMYVLLAVFCVAILVFTVNCVVFMLRYRRKRIPKGPKDTVSQAHDWVWIGRSTLERNGAHHTRCSQTLMPEEDFNGNQMIVRPQSSSHSSNSSQNGGSNRNSTVSTYKGSECSIRITANPLLDGAEVPNPEDAEWDYEAMGMTYDQLMEYFDNLKESTA